MIKIDVNPSTLSTNLSFIYYPWPSVRLECLEQIGPSTTERCADNFISLEYIGKSLTSTFYIYNARRESGRFILSYLQSVTSHLVCGAEIVLEWNKMSLVGQTALAIRYLQMIVRYMFFFVVGG